MSASSEVNSHTFEADAENHGEHTAFVAGYRKLPHVDSHARIKVFTNKPPIVSVDRCSLEKDAQGEITRITLRATAVDLEDGFLRSTKENNGWTIRYLDPSGNTTKIVSEAPLGVNQEFTIPAQSPDGAPPGTTRIQVFLSAMDSNGALGTAFRAFE